MESRTRDSSWKGFLPTNALVMAKRSVDSPDPVDPADLLFVCSKGFANQPAEIELLDKIISGMGFAAANRLKIIEILEGPPDATEALIKAIRPRIVVALGEGVTHALLKNSNPFSQLRGQFQKLAQDCLLMPTWPLSELSKNLELKRQLWLDLKAVQNELKKEN